MMRGLFADVRHAMRATLARPGFSAVVIVTLALGIGANTAIFSAVHALLLRPFPFPDADRLVRISTVRGSEEGFIAVPEEDDLRSLSHIVGDIARYTDQGMYNASGFGQPEELQSTITTHNLFRVLGVRLAAGNTFEADADRSRRFELVISHGLWLRRFGGDPSVVGRTMTLDGAPGYTIHGVLPEGVNFPTNSDLFRSSGISADPKSYERRDIRGHYGLVRLQDGVTVAQAQAEVDRLAARLAREFPDSNAGLGFKVTPLRDLYVSNVRGYLWLLFGAVGLVLVIACANVANLLLSRAIARDREHAVRLALGAGRGRLVRAALVESAWLALLGGVFGLAIALAGVRIVTALVPAQLPSWMAIEVDAAALAFLFVVSIVAGTVAGLVPALGLTEGQLHNTLREGGRGSSGGRRDRRARSVLVIAEVALAMLLLAGASLMLQSVRRLLAVDPGFDANGVLTFRVELGWRAYGSADAIIAFNEQMLTRLSGLPGVVAVARDSNLPLSGRPREPVEIVADGQSIADQQANPYVNLHGVSSGYFETMKIPLLRGRAFDDGDRATAQPVAIVSRRLADRLWPQTDPVGRPLTIRGSNVKTVVVGVADDAALEQVGTAPGFELYRPYRQWADGGAYFIVRTHGVDPQSLSLPATAFVQQLDPNQSFFDVQTMRMRMEQGIWQQRAAGALFGAFAVLALTLAAIGLYGVLSYLVVQQQREIGVRIALGASRSIVLGTVLARGLTLTGIGVAIGLVAAAAGAQSIRHLLFDVPALDGLSFVAVPVLLLVVAGLACAIPAYRATRVDPLIALRSE